MPYHDRPYLPGGSSDGRPRASLPRRLAWLWAASLLAWGAVLGVLALRKYLTRLATDVPADLPRIAWMLAPDFAGFIVLTPLAVLLAGRLPLFGPRRRRNRVLHLGLGLAFGLGVAAVTAAADPTLHPTLPGEGPPPLPVRVRYHFASHFMDDLVAYLGVALVANAAAYYRAFRGRELRAARLEARLSQARLTALRSQLQPHFLFNTLHSVSALMEQDPAAARRMIADLQALLRLSLDRSHEQEVPLRREMDILEQYVNIQRTRFPDRLATEWRIADEARDALVPRLLLQPLVENAIRHGVGPRRRAGRVEVTAAREDGALVLAVRDDGVGLGAAGRPAREGIGLGNTRARLAALYGGAGTLRVGPTPGGGTTVEVRIPFRPAAPPAAAAEG
jgi:two-component system LytT family sensor kinase